MARLQTKNGTFILKFRYKGRDYTRSLKTSDKEVATVALHEAKNVIVSLDRGWLAVPSGVLAADYIASGGHMEAIVEKPIMPTINQAVDEYLAHLGHLAESTRGTTKIHLGHLQEKMNGRGGDPLDQLTCGDLDRYLEVRLKKVAPTTVHKERDTIVAFLDWSVNRNYLNTSPATGLRPIKSSGDRPAFRTLTEINNTITRGGLSASEVLDLWECLFLMEVEIAELLNLVRERSAVDVSFILHAVPAYTGMRRGEVLRQRWTDIEFEQNSLIARSLKQSRQVVETKRRIDLHPQLKSILLCWREQRPKGQFVVCDPDTIDPLTPPLANRRFWQPLKGTHWCLNGHKKWYKIGFHTYRHSFASNLAAKNVDQRIIDEFMGHQSESMRRRYRHLFPAARRSAIESISFALPVKAEPVILADTEELDLVGLA